MKRILLLSDSHGNVDNMAEAVRREKPDLILHMGDCWNDAVRLRRRFPGIPLEQVVGNCDFNQGESERLLEVEGKRILMCHGHTYGVKSSLLTLEYAGREKDADIILFGHTHQLFYDRCERSWMINPGSIAGRPLCIRATYAVITLEEGNDDIRLETGRLTDD